ncbi:hypothetical protein JOC85_002455 [Bacillus mesophilus]|uniref:hypothetical protein n=1 Tax=Bacillus mesophilus TaxID=1808955 RepID=UPI00195F1EA6|nr:hypothetical protein [Bacillus mesophilus]MBM7661652.1 hypothetical protein [Bacillus mesophilus]
MGFLRDLGKFSGQAVGFVVGGAVNVVGDVTGNKFIKEVGDGVKKASEFAGDTLGQVADGTWNTASGMIQNDDKKIDKGLGDIGNSVSRTAKGVYQTAKGTYHSGKDVYEGFKYNDDEKIKSGASNIAKTVAIGVLAVGVVDFVDGPESGDPTNNSPNMAEGNNNAQQIQSQAQTGTTAPIESSDQPGVNHVKPHWVDSHWRDGQYIEGYWRDGDGNTAVNVTEEQGGGYLRSNPDGSLHNNLKS